MSGSCTVFFDGRFWVALAERRGPSGEALYARHVFGPEPSNPELLLFYKDVLASLPYVRGAAPGGVTAKPPRAKPKGKPKERDRVSRSLEAYKAATTEQSADRKRERTQERRAREAERYEARKAKRKERS